MWFLGAVVFCSLFFACTGMMIFCVLLFKAFLFLSSSTMTLQSFILFCHFVAVNTGMVIFGVLLFKAYVFLDTVSDEKELGQGCEES